jgi:hypothetical protein
MIFREVSNINLSVSKGSTRMLGRERQKWAEQHALRIVRRFEPWQKPLGIDGDKYLKYLTRELIVAISHSGSLLSSQFLERVWHVSYCSAWVW